MPDDIGSAMAARLAGAVVAAYPHVLVECDGEVRILPRYPRDGEDYCLLRVVTLGRDRLDLVIGHTDVREHGPALSLDELWLEIVLDWLDPCVHGDVWETLWLRGGAVVASTLRVGSPPRLRPHRPRLARRQRRHYAPYPLEAG